MTPSRRTKIAAGMTTALALAAAGAMYAPAGASNGLSITIGTDLGRSCVPGCPPPAFGAIGLVNLPGAEIAAYDARHKRAWVTDAGGNQLSLVDLRTPASPTLIRTVSLAGHGATVTSVSISGRHVVAGTRPDAGAGALARGTVVLMDLEGVVTDTATAGFGPDSVTFTPDGRRVLVANEGEPNSYGQSDSVDPPGSVTILDVRNGSFTRVREVTFTGLTAADLPAGVRISSPGATVAQDLEPEFTSFSSDSRTAYITLQENNAVAEIDVDAARLSAIRPLGHSDHSREGFGIDASDRDGAIDITARKALFGIRMPDAIATFRHAGRTYYVTANEGDARDYTGFVDEWRVKDIPVAELPSTWTAEEKATLRTDAELGRLTVTRAAPWSPGGPLYSYGSRSFSIFDDKGRLVHDSGSDFEDITAARIPAMFNSESGIAGSFDTRSDNKGPEPEGLTVGEAYGHRILVVGLERVGGLMIYDIGNPRKPKLLTYLPGSAATAGPEGIVFVPAGEAPGGRPLILVANEVAGSLSVIEVRRR